MYTKNVINAIKSNINRKYNLVMCIILTFSTFEKVRVKDKSCHRNFNLKAGRTNLPHEALYIF